MLEKSLLLVTEATLFLFGLIFNKATNKTTTRPNQDKKKKKKCVLLPLLSSLIAAWQDHSLLEPVSSGLTISVYKIDFNLKKTLKMELKLPNCMQTFHTVDK